MGLHGISAGAAFVLTCKIASIHAADSLARSSPPIVHDPVTAVAQLFRTGLRDTDAPAWREDELVPAAAEARERGLLDANSESGLSDAGENYAHVLVGRLLSSDLLREFPSDTYCLRNLYGPFYGASGPVSIDQIDAIMECLVHAGSRNVLDLGCGNGVLTCEMQRRSGGRYLGVDRSRAHINEATARAHSLQVKFRHDDLEAASFPKECAELDTGVDAVLAVDVLHELRDPTWLLARLQRFLPGVRLYILSTSHEGAGVSEAERISDAFRINSIPYIVQDHSPALLRYWTRLEDLLTTHCAEYLSEGAGLIHGVRMLAAKRMQGRVQAGHTRRLLFIGEA